MRCLAIDFGSSTIKGCVLDLDSGEVDHLVREAFPDRLANTNFDQYEVCPRQIVLASRKVIEQLIFLAPDAKRLYTASQMGGCILIGNRQQTLSNYLSWRDQRSVRRDEIGNCVLEIIRERLSPVQYQQLGCELKPGSATCLLYWLNKHRLLEPNVQVVSIGDYVLSQLCGCEPRWHRTLAIGLLNLMTGQWHREVFYALGLEDVGWPELINEHEPVGEMPTELNSVQCFASIGDQQAALRGAKLLPGDLSINCSTGSQVSEIRPNFVAGDYQTRFWFGGEYLNTITHIPAGRSLFALHDLLTELQRRAGQKVENSWQLIAQACQQVAQQPARQQTAIDGSKLLRCDLGFFDSALGFDGRIEGITTENLSVGNLFEAAFEYMANAYATCATKLNGNYDWQRVVTSGGLLQMFPTLRSRLKSRFSMPLIESTAEEETLLGLMTIAREVAT